MFARIAVLAAVAGALLALYLTGAFELITDEVRAREAIEAAGLWAPVLYVLAFSLGEPFFIPGFAFIIPGSVAFDYVELVILSWLGSIGAGIVGFSFARFVGRDFVS